jgi:transcriptional regulator with XRE-family HTH domain
MDIERLNTDQRIDFAASLRTIRHTYGYSQAQLAELAELHVTYISRLENGKRNPTLYTIENIARAFGMTTVKFVKELQNS